MSCLGNLLWILLGGGLLALLWFVAAILCCVTIVLIPVGVQCFKFAGLALCPFGKTVEYGGNVGHFLLNILWLVLFGWELAVASFVVGLVWCITIVGIPMGLQSFKLARLALMPFGAKVVKA